LLRKTDQKHTLILVTKIKVKTCYAKIKIKKVGVYESTTWTKGVN